MATIFDSENMCHGEEGLMAMVVELKTQIEENELVHGLRDGTSKTLYVPKDPSYFMKERNLELKRLMNYPIEKPSKVLSEVIQSEINSCDKSEYNDKSLPFLINQHIVNRSEMLVIMKHSLMLRWKRYCITKDLQDIIVKEYRERLKKIDTEYAFLIDRVHRLQVIKEGYVCNSDQGIEEITPEDLLMYIKDLGTQFYSMRYMAQIIRILQWISIKYRKKKKDTKSVDRTSVTKSEKSLKVDVSSETSFRSEHSKAISAKPSEAVLTESLTEQKYATHGGGLAIDEKNLNMPLHTNNMIHFLHILTSLCKVYSIEMNIKKVKTSADEMELFSHVNRKFKSTFFIQEQMRTFKVYDKTDGAGDRWGIDSSQHALLKPATWLEHNPFKRKINLIVCKYLNRLRSEKCLDEFLKVAATFIKKSNAEDTQNSLRHHALLIQHLPVVHNTWVVANPNGFTVSDIFKLIYNKVNVNMKTFSVDDGNQDITEGEDTYKFTETLQMLGLDECETKDDPSSVQGAYLSYLNLRFLKIRDLQRTCLSAFNYFRSIERTLVINTHGFSKQEVPKLIRLSSRDLDQEISYQNLGSHQYLFDNIDDYKIPNVEFMQYAEIINHDDYYLNEEGRLHIKDRMNYWIMYDVAVKDFEELEEELILIGSYYVNIDKDYRLTSLFNRKKSQAETDNGAAFITEYGHREVDRFGVLYDIWNLHTEFLENKMRLIDLYMEVYNSIVVREEKMEIAQIISDIMYQKPRLDITLNYFINSYRLESKILVQECLIMQKILDKEKDRFRNYMSMEGNSSEDECNLVKQLLINVNTDRSVLKPMYLLEFIPSFGMISKIKKTLDFAFATLRVHSDVITVQAELKKNLDFLYFIDNEITENDIFSGNPFDTDVFKQLFSPLILDNPKKLLELGELYIKNIDSRNTRGEKKSRKIKFVNEFGRFLDLVNVRFRLIDMLYECKYLTTIYLLQASNLGYADYHAYLRLAPFETAKRKESAESQKPYLFISSTQDDETLIDNYEPQEFDLAIHDLDCVHLGKFLLSDVSTILELLLTRGLEDMQLTLKMQSCHTCSLAIGVLLCDVCRPSVFVLTDLNEFNDLSRTDTGTLQTNVHPLSLQSGPIPLALDKNKTKELSRFDFYPEAFFSFQLEKMPIRDRMLNAFVKKYPSKLTSMELEKAKREHVTYFINAFNERISNAALKAQIISCYSSIINILKPFPDIAESFFQFGVDSKPGDDIDQKLGNYDNDYHHLRKRCRKVISDDGKLINIWYIPHFTEILYFLRVNDDVVTKNILLNFLLLVQAFRDILHYIIGIWSISSDNTRVTDKLKSDIRKENELSEETNCFNIIHQLHFDTNHSVNIYTDYDSTNRCQLEKEFVDLELQIQNLNDPTNVEEVVKLLQIRKDYHYYYFDAFVTSILPEFLLASNNFDIYQKLRHGIDSIMILVTTDSNSSFAYKELNVPLPFLNRDEKAKKLFPWRFMLNSEGPFVINFETWINIVENIQICFAEIPNEDRHFLKDQFYTFNLLIEDILLQRRKVNKFKMKEAFMSESDIFLLSKKFQKIDKKEVGNINELSSKDGLAEGDSTIFKNNSSIFKHPIETYKYLVNHLLALKKFNLLKNTYCSKKLKIPISLAPKQYLINSQIFKRDILLPKLRKLSHELSLPNFYYFGPSSENDIVVYPKGVSLTFVTQTLIKALIEEIHKINISEIKCCIATKLDKVIKERNYDGKEADSLYYTALKKTYLKPTLYKDLIKKIEVPLLDGLEKVTIVSTEVTNKEAKEEEEEEETKDKNEETILKIKDKRPTEKILLSKTYLNKCLQFLGNSVQLIQKDSYESNAMFFENILKQQQYLLKQKDIIIKDLRDELQQKEESILVQRQFILAECVGDLIMEINYLRAQLIEEKQKEQEQPSMVRKNISLEYRAAVRNIYALGFEQLTHMKIAVEKFRCSVNQNISKTRVEAFNDMKRVKERSAAKFTVDDDLMERNISISQNINKNQIENLQLAMVTSRMKSIFNWIYTYLFNVNDKEIKEYENEAKKHEDVVFVTQQIWEQKIKLIKCEIKRLHETLKISELDLAGLKATLRSEINQKSRKSKTEEIMARKIQEGINHKRKQIDNMLELIKATNSKIASMHHLFDEHMTNKDMIQIKSNKQVGKLKKILFKERELKQEAFMKVDDLISQVYEFEAAFAVTKDNVKPREKQVSTIESLSKPRNPTTKPGHPTINLNYSPPEKSVQRLSYKTVVSQHCNPYTSCHFLPFRRDRLSLHKIRTKLRKQFVTEKDNKNSAANFPKFKRTSSYKTSKN